MPRPALPAAAALLAAFTAPLHAASQCEARSGAMPPAVVELYTSEGCSSCPPADQWLSALKGRSDVVALAFHVNYWDKLGWPDRFATPATTERQHEVQRSAGASYVYTPQVVLNGRDLRGWSSAKISALPASPVTLMLAREGNQVRASVGGSTQALAGYWAVLEDGHASRVKAGENAGATLAHDHVVTLYRPVAAWSPAGASKTLTLDLPASGTQARRVAFVVTDAAGGKPLQAVVLGC